MNCSYSESNVIDIEINNDNGQIDPLNRNEYVATILITAY